MASAKLAGPVAATERLQEEYHLAGRSWTLSRSSTVLMRLANLRYSTCCGFLWSPGLPGMLTAYSHPLMPCCDNGGAAPVPLVSDRKLRLLSCACCRREWHLLSNDSSRRSMLLAEQYADGLVSNFSAQEASLQAEAFYSQHDLVGGRESALAALAAVAAETNSTLFRFSLTDRLDALYPNCSFPACLLHEMVPNPFAPVQVPWTQESCGQCYGSGSRKGKRGSRKRCRYCHGCGVISPWINATTLALAWAAYDNQDASSGQLDCTRLAILADALEELGCPVQEERTISQVLRDRDNAIMGGCCDRFADNMGCDCLSHAAPDGILAHLRSPGPHFRGCWAVDLILGKE